MRGTGHHLDPDRLAAALEQSGLTRSALARAVSAAPARISEYAAGRGAPEAPRLAALARALGCAPADLLPEGALEATLSGLRLNSGLTLAHAADGLRAHLGGEPPCHRALLSTAEQGTLPAPWRPCSAADAVRGAMATVYAADPARVEAAWRATFPGSGQGRTQTVTPRVATAGASDIAKPVAPQTVRAGERPQERRARQAWQRLNERQRAHLTAIFHADQNAEADIAARQRDWLPVPSAQEWRWQHFATEAPASLVGYTTIQIELKSQGLLSQGSGSTLAKLRRDGLIEETGDLSPLGFAMVLVRLTRLGRAAARAGLKVPTKARTPPGMLSEWLFTTLARLYAAGEEGLEPHPIKRVPAEQFVSDRAMVHLDGRRRDGAFITYGGHRYQRRVALTPLAIEHYERCWSCYRELYPNAWAPEPRRRPESAHPGLEAHHRKRPKGMLTRPQWRLLTELHRIDASGSCGFKRWAQTHRREDGRSTPELARLPNGLQEWEIKKRRASPKAATALEAFPAGALAARYDVGPLLPDRRPSAGPLWLWHITPAGCDHVLAHHRAYTDLYPDIPAPTITQEET